MSRQLSAAQRRHLEELVADGPYWYPIGIEFRTADTLTRMGLLHHIPYYGANCYQLTDEGRAAVADTRTGEGA